MAVGTCLATAFDPRILTERVYASWRHVLDANSHGLEAIRVPTLFVHVRDDQFAA